jgi:hypothetical protein
VIRIAPHPKGPRFNSFLTISFCPIDRKKADVINPWEDVIHIQLPETSLSCKMGIAISLWRRGLNQVSLKP